MYLICDLHGQYGGKLDVAERMLLECKMLGASAAKVQLYDPLRLSGNNRNQYLSLTFDELKGLTEYARHLRLDFFASFFDEERLDWCLELNFPVLKVASTLVSRFPELAERAIASGRRCIVSMGMHDWEGNGFPYKAPNVEYLYCVAKYPATLEDIKLPVDLPTAGFSGYSCHAPGLTACKVAITRGAKILEKHYTTSHALQKESEKAHACGLNAEQLSSLRAFWEEYDVLTAQGPAYGFLEQGR